MTDIDKAWEQYREKRGLIHESRSNNTEISKVDFYAGFEAGINQFVKEKRRVVRLNNEKG